MAAMASLMRLGEGGAHQTEGVESEVPASEAAKKMMSLIPQNSRDSGRRSVPQPRLCQGRHAERQGRKGGGSGRGSAAAGTDLSRGWQARAATARERLTTRDRTPEESHPGVPARRCPGTRQPRARSRARCGTGRHVQALDIDLTGAASGRGRTSGRQPGHGPWWRVPRPCGRQRRSACWRALWREWRGREGGGAEVRFAGRTDEGGHESLDSQVRWCQIFVSLFCRSYTHYKVLFSTFSLLPIGPCSSSLPPDGWGGGLRRRRQHRERSPVEHQLPVGEAHAVRLVAHPAQRGGGWARRGEARRPCRRRAAWLRCVGTPPKMFVVRRLN